MPSTSRPLTVSLLAIAAITALPLQAQAHHEAIFGPQSSLVISSPAFVSLQAFSRRSGRANQQTQETTGLLSAGLSPLEDVPVSVSVIAPASYIHDLGSGSAVMGVEDIILGARYRYDLEGLQQAFGREGNFLLGMAAAELPTGTVDYPAFQGPLDGWLAALGSVEYEAFSAIGYGFYRLNGVAHDQSRAGDNLFTGGGLAWTPFDDPATERLFSVQFGVSYELTFQDQLAGERVAGTGGWGVLAHPTLVWGPGGHVLLFGMASVPILQSYEDPSAQDAWRVGMGAIYLFGH